MTPLSAQISQRLRHRIMDALYDGNSTVTAVVPMRGPQRDRLFALARTRRTA